MLSEELLAVASMTRKRKSLITAISMHVNVVVNGTQKSPVKLTAINDDGLRPANTTPKKSPRQNRTRTLIVWLLEIPRKFDAIRHAL